MPYKTAWTDRAKKILEELWYRYRIGEIDREDLERTFNLGFSTIRNFVSKSGIAAKVQKRITVQINESYLALLKKRGIKI
jgi:hypothetical protein